MIEVRVEGDRTLCAVVGEMTIYQANEHRDALITAYQSAREGSRGLEVDLSQIDEIDSAGLQLLAGLKREAEEQKYAIRYVNPSPSAQELMQLYWLNDYFGC